MIVRSLAFMSVCWRPAVAQDPPQATGRLEGVVVDALSGTPGLRDALRQFAREFSR